ncbi:MAG: alpha/beta fold hydrolase [Chitinophagaceae bacterium]|nr:alpha/beta fold hydrolase [Chitinophagaceae bacterium]MCW5905849.1 alpha/beta fold hydrolase [Chitinophagaceae bacterium]
MKLKLAQRIAISYYKTKIKAISLLSKKLAAEKAFELFCTPYSGKPKRKEPPIFHYAEKVSCNIKNLTITGWKWTPKNNNGKKILIAHGFDSCSYKFDNYVQPLMQEGFIVFAFDAPAHGLSGGKTADAWLYRNTIIEIDKQFEHFYCIIGHSFGGLSASLAAEIMPQLQKLILIAPATETQRAIDNFFKIVTFGDDIKAELEKIIVAINQQPISYYSVTRSIQHIKANILWVHDKNDWICPFEDVQPAINLQLRNTEFYITKGLGHNKIYRNKDVVRYIVHFLHQTAHNS